MRDIGMRDHTGRSMDACNPESLWDQLAAATQRAEVAEQRAAALQRVAFEFVTHHDNGQAGQPGFPRTYGEVDVWQAEWDRRYAALALAASGGAAPAVQAGGE